MVSCDISQRSCFLKYDFAGSLTVNNRGVQLRGLHANILDVKGGAMCLPTPTFYQRLV